MRAVIGTGSGFESDICVGQSTGDIITDRDTTGFISDMETSGGITSGWGEG